MMHEGKSSMLSTMKLDNYNKFESTDRTSFENCDPNAYLSMNTNKYMHIHEEIKYLPEK